MSHSTAKIWGEWRCNKKLSELNQSIHGMNIQILRSYPSVLLHRSNSDFFDNTVIYAIQKYSQKVVIMQVYANALKI